MNELEAAVHATAKRAKAASRQVAALSLLQRNAALEAMALALELAGPALLAANADDLRAASARTGDDVLPPATLSRLRLTPEKLSEMAEQVRSVVRLPDPLGRFLARTELDDKDPAGPAPAERFPAEEHGLQLEKISVPLGVLAVIFEARPDAVTQIAALALKSGNAAVLKPGSEVERTAQALVEVLQKALHAQGLTPDALTILPGREAVRALLREKELVDLVIPRGSNQLVEFVQNNTHIPVLGHSEGVCHIYVDRAAEPQLALGVILDAKLDYPAACNAVETVLVHEGIAASFLPALVSRLLNEGVRVHAEQDVSALLGRAEAAKLEPVGDWHREYGTAELAIRIVPSLEVAIDHIHTFGSAHTESILTEDLEAAERFLREVDAAGVFHNVSTRFADGFRYGFGAEVGISTSKLHARGPVGLEGLTTYKYVLRGSGHVASAYRGPGARSFTHRPQDLSRSASSS